MSPKKLVVLSAVVLLLFAFIVLFERKLPSTAEIQSKGDLHWDLPEDRVESLTLERGNEIIELVREGESWKIVRPEAWPADSFAVSELTGSLADLKRAGGDGEGAKPEDYGLAPPAAKATFVWTEKDGSARETRIVEFGTNIPGTDISAARIAGTARIFFVPQATASGVKRPLTELKSRDVFTGTAADVVSADVERGRDHLVLERRSGAWWLAQPIGDLADSEAAERLVSDLVGLRVSEFLPAGRREELPALGLAPPLYRVTLADAKGAKRTLDLGATRSDGETVYAHRDGQIFTIDSAIVEELSREAVTYRSSRLVAFERSDVSEISAVFEGGSRYVFVRNDSGWSFQGRPLLASAVDDTLAVIREARSRSFLDASEAARASSRPAAATVTVKRSNGETSEIRLHPFNGGAAAIVRGRPGAFPLPEEILGRLSQAFQKAATAPATTPKPAAAPAATPRAAKTP